MNKAFEKILKRLEEVENRLLNESGDIGCTLGITNMYEYSKQIVQKVSEEFATDTNVGTNGWIPCSDGLPEECTEVLVSVKEIDGSFYTRTSWVQDGVWVIKKTPLQPTVIAWQTLPEPYKESED